MIAPKNEVVAADSSEPGWLAAAALLCGCASRFSIDIVGELFLAEVLLPVLAVVLLLSRWPSALFASNRFRILVIAALLMLAGYVISDLVAGTSPANYWRGWARVVVLIVSVFSLAVIVERSRWNLWWFWLGWGICGLVTLVIDKVPLANWKFGYGDALAVTVAAVSALLPWSLSAILLLGFGAVSIVFDYRSLGAILMLIGALVWVSKWHGNRHATKMSVLPLLLGLGLVSIAMMYFVGLGASTESIIERREMSNSNRFTALRIGAIAIADSPIIGYGSWGEGTAKYARMYYQETLGSMVDMGLGQIATQGNSLMAHSQIIQSWMEGGLLAAAFFLAYGFFLFRQVADFAMKRPPEALSGFLLFILMTNLWHLFMSPFNGAHRLEIASAVAVLASLSIASIVPDRIVTRSGWVARRPANLME